MSSRPGSGTKISTGHRRSESNCHHRPSSASSSHNRSDSGQSLNSDYHGHQKHTHHRSKSGVHEREVDKESCSSACKHIKFLRFIVVVQNMSFTIKTCI